MYTRTSILQSHTWWPCCNNQPLNLIAEWQLFLLQSVVPRTDQRLFHLVVVTLNSIRDNLIISHPLNLYRPFYWQWILWLEDTSVRVALPGWIQVSLSICHSIQIDRAKLVTRTKGSSEFVYGPEVTSRGHTTHKRMWPGQMCNNSRVDWWW